MSTQRKGYHHYYDFFVAKATTENKYGTFKSPIDAVRVKLPIMALFLFGHSGHSISVFDTTIFMHRQTHRKWSFKNEKLFKNNRFSHFSK